MKTTAILSAILALTATTLANPVPEAGAAVEVSAPLEKRADQYFTFWTDVGFKGSKGNIKNPGSFTCYNLAAPFQDSISSAGPTSGLVCTLWADYNCKGSGVTLRYPGVSDLRTVNFNDAASSYQCAPA